MLEHEGAFECEQSGDDVEDDDLGGDEETPELFDGHRFRAATAAVFGLGVCAKTSRKSFLVEPWQLAVCGDGEQLVGEIHEDAVVTRGVVGEGDAPLAWS